MPRDKYPTVPFKRKLTVHCESRFSTRFTIPARIENNLSRIESRIESHRTENKRFTGHWFLDNFTKTHSCNTTWHGYIRDSRFAKATVCSKEDQYFIRVIKWNVSSRTSVSSFISSSKILNACSICKHTVYTHVQATACLICNVHTYTRASVTWLISESAFMPCVLHENFRETMVLILQGNLRIL